VLDHHDVPVTLEAGTATPVPERTGVASVVCGVHASRSGGANRNPEVVPREEIDRRIRVVRSLADRPRAVPYATDLDALRCLRRDDRNPVGCLGGACLNPWDECADE
jgi:hypothetical protein